MRQKLEVDTGNFRPESLRFSNLLPHSASCSTLRDDLAQGLPYMSGNMPGAVWRDAGNTQPSPMSGDMLLVWMRKDPILSLLRTRGDFPVASLRFCMAQANFAEVLLGPASVLRL